MLICFVVFFGGWFGSLVFGLTLVLCLEVCLCLRGFYVCYLIVGDIDGCWFWFYDCVGCRYVVGVLVDCVWSDYLRVFTDVS